MDSSQQHERPNARVKTYYDNNPESNRFDSPHGKLEFERSKRFLNRHLPNGSADILDLGGGTGAYSFWLAAQGHRMSFIDLSAGHVDKALAQNEESFHKLFSIQQGNALKLPFDGEAFDVVLCMGPLYHLSPNDRLLALAECHRVLREGGIAILAYISRFAAVMDGYKKGMINDPVYVPLAEGDIVNGIHESANDAKYFTLAYMHRPEEVEPELRSADFKMEELIGVEGVFWTYPNLEQYVENKVAFERLLGHAELIEHEPSIVGASAHFLAAAKPF